MKPFSVCIVALLLLFMTVLIAPVVEVHGRNWKDEVLNPCKAEGYLGDVALTHDEYRTSKKLLIRKTTNDSLFELQKEDDCVSKKDSSAQDENKEELQSFKDSLDKELKDKVKALMQVCDQNYKVPCLQNKIRLQEDIINIRIKWMRLKAQLRRTTHGDLEVKITKQDIVSVDDQSSSMNTNTSNSTFKKRNTNTLCTHNAIQKRTISRTRRGATKNKNRLWDDGVIPFAIDDMFSIKDKDVFKFALENWEEHTCIVFKEKEPVDQNYILFTKGDCGCCSFVGKEGKAQEISIGDGCNKLEIVTHELGHVIGFYHEHTRKDRDNYIHIINENIKEKEQYNFDIQNDIDSLNETYDYDSIMHYDRNTLSKKPHLNTIQAIMKQNVVIAPLFGQKAKPSDGDIRQVKKLYRCASCGQTLLEPSGVFNHQPKLGTPELCQWRISAGHGERIVLNIIDLDLPESNNCETDYLAIRDGHYIKSPLIRRICANEPSDAAITSTGNQMWIEFKTNNGEGKGFAARYETECGGEIVKDEGKLTSPDYPNDYPGGKECVWTITVPESSTIILEIDFFELEFRNRCYRDYLEVRDGLTKESPLMGTFCGSQAPQVLETSGRHLYVKFVSSTLIHKPGFSARFIKEMDECSTDTPGCEHVCVNTLGSYHCSCRIGYQLHSDEKRCEPACGGIIHSQIGNVTSPSFPDLYPSNRKCIWQISASIGHKIYLNFTYFDLEEQGQVCNYDFVRVSSGALAVIHGTFCGFVLPAPITSVDNTLRIEFSSDSTVGKTGFSAEFIADKDECAVNNGGCDHTCRNTVGSFQCECNSGFILLDNRIGCKEERCQYEIRAHDGFIYSNSYPGYYPGREDCLWHITTAPGHRLRLSFRVFNVEPHQKCLYDHLAVFDGDSTRAPLLGKYCGSTVPDPVISKGNNIVLTFFSDASVQRTGFEIEHDVLCGAHLIASETEEHFVSHAGYGDVDYDVRQDCQWIIQANKGRLIQLKFTDFEVESDEECGYDSVTVYDGPNDTDFIIGVYCGLEIPDTILSSTEYLLIHFLSDDSVNRKGFSATYQLVPTATNN